MESSSPPNAQQADQNNNNNYNYPSFNPNWLGFSLTPNPLDLSLFHPHIPFFPPPPQGNNFQHQQDGGTSDYTGGPKLEDFLGGSGIYPGGAGHDASTVFYGARSVEAVGGLHGLMTAAAADEYGPLDIYNKQQQQQEGGVVSSSAVPEAPPTPAAKKSADTFGHRTSIYRGVTRHRWTGRYEAHLWDNTCKREGQSRKGRQVYLGGYDKEEKAARAYDLAALKYWGATTTTNFPILDYEKELEEMQHMTRQEFVASLRRKSSGFSRGASIYRGVTRHHQHGRWQARIGRVAGNKDLYLGTFSTQEEAAEAYDIAAIKFRGANAVTNFDISRYDVRSIASSNLPVGGLSNKPASKPTSSIATKNITSDHQTIPFHVSGLQSSTTLSFATAPNTTNQATSSAHMISWPHSAAPSTEPAFNMGFYGEQQQMDANSTKDVSFATPMSSAMSAECGAKANLSALHTLIFGME